MDDRERKDRGEAGPPTLLDWLGLSDEPDFSKARPLGGLVTLLIALLTVLALVAAVAVLVHTIRQTADPAGAGPNLGAGALIAAFLGAPLVIWATWLRHRALGFQKEGHITDRINKAVEMLGAEKTVDRIGRPITVLTGKSRTVTHLVADEREFVLPRRSHVTGRDYGQSWLEEKGDVFEGLHLDVTTWDSERTVIEWQNQPLEIAAKEAIDKVGSWEVFSETIPNIEVRLGAILSLERIAQDSTAYDRGRDHVRVMEILCAYVRQNAPAEGLEDHPFGEWEPLKGNPTKEERAAHEAKRKERFGGIPLLGEVRAWAEALPKPCRADVALTLSVIGRRTARQRLVEAAWPDPPARDTVWPFDIPSPAPPAQSARVAEVGTHLRDLGEWIKRIESYGGYRVDLRGANLRRANLSQLTLSGADLRDTRMEGTNLVLARIEGADLTNARMEGAELSAAWMEGVDLRNARMEGANLYWTKMGGADLREAQMQGAFLRMAQMHGARVHWAEMGGADLSGARMDGADLFGVEKDSGTSLAAAASLRGAAARLVNWSEVTFTQDQIAEMFGDASVILPEGLTRPEHWPDWNLPWGGDLDFHAQWRLWLSDPAAYVPPPKPKE